jgi:plasmid stabilization system protein ParE
VALVKKTYRVFYRVEEENKKVIIVRVIRTDQNIEEILFD